jgi:superfamily I DNA/RNA helicase
MDSQRLSRWRRVRDGGLSELRPDPDHDAVCAAGGQHLVVVAPPGTGKTCLSIRLGGVHAAELRPEQRVLLLTFSNQARVQLEKEAARQLTPELRTRVEVTNYHRFFYRAVRAYLRALGLPLTADLWSSESRQKAPAVLDAKLASRLRKDEILYSLAEFRFPEFRDERTPDDGVLERLLEVVDAENAAGRLVFDDLGALFWRLVTTHPSVDAAYRHRYPVVIADEHQDASELQDALVRRLGDERRIVLRVALPTISPRPHDHDAIYIPRGGRQPMGCFSRDPRGISRGCRTNPSRSAVRSRLPPGWRAPGCRFGLSWRAAAGSCVIRLRVGC